MKRSFVNESDHCPLIPNSSELQQNKFEAVLSANGKVQTANTISKTYELDLLYSPYCDRSTFEGFTIDQYAAIIYLLEKHANLHTPLGINKFLKRDNARVEHSFIVWNVEKQKLTVPYGFNAAFVKSIGHPQKYRFVFGFIDILFKKDIHVVCFVYDCSTECLEFFDPDGETPSYLFILLMDKLVNHFVRLKIKRENIFKCRDFCPYNSFQTYQSQENQEKRAKRDPMGYCAAWAIWYLDLKFTNAHLNLSRKELVDTALAKLLKQKDTQSMTSFIRNYGNFIIRKRNDILLDTLSVPKNLSNEESIVKLWRELLMSQEGKPKFIRTRDFIIQKYGATFEYYLVLRLHHLLTK